MTATVFRQRIIRKNTILVFVQSKKIFLLLERWAEEKWIQLSFSSAILCRITQAITTVTGSQPSHPTSCLAAILIPRMQCWAPTGEILVEAQISDPLAFHFSLPGKHLLVVLEGNFEPAETGTWLPKDFLGYANVSGFSLVSTHILWTLFCFLFSCEFLCEEKWNLSVDVWFWSCLGWCISWFRVLFYLLKAWENDWAPQPTPDQTLSSHCYSSTGGKGQWRVWKVANELSSSWRCISS